MFLPSVRAATRARIRMESMLGLMLGVALMAIVDKFLQRRKKAYLSFLFYETFSKIRIIPLQMFVR